MVPCALCRFCACVLVNIFFFHLAIHSDSAVIWPVSKLREALAVPSWTRVRGKKRGVRGGFAATCRRIMTCRFVPWHMKKYVPSMSAYFVGSNFQLPTSFSPATASSPRCSSGVLSSCSASTCQYIFQLAEYAMLTFLYLCFATTAIVVQDDASNSLLRGTFITER
jgi:hypothetical protein